MSGFMGRIDPLHPALSDHPVLARAVSDVCQEGRSPSTSECSYQEYHNDLSYNDADGHVYHGHHQDVPSCGAVHEGREWILVNPLSGRCNLACAYCYRGDDHSEATYSFRMDEDTLEALIESALNCYAEVSFIWHGGEPLLAGRDFYDNCLRIQRKYARPGQLVENLVQTNATLLDEEWVEFLRHHEFGIGLSMDGPAEIHNRQRSFPDGSPSLDQVEAAIGLLRERQMRFGVLAVVTKLSLQRAPELYHLMHNTCSHFDFLPYGGHKQSDPLALDPGDYGKFMADLFDLWIQDGNPDTDIRLLSNVLQMSVGGRPRICSLAGKCERYVSVEANGDIYPCGRFSCFPQMRLGNIRETGLLGALEGEVSGVFTRMNEEARAACSDCEWFTYCHADCTAYRFDSASNSHRKSYFCESRRYLFEHVREYVSTALSA